MTKEPAKQTNKDNEDLTPYVTKGGKIVLENAPEMWRGGRYAAESAWKHGVKKPIGKLWFKWDAHTIGKDANTIYDIVNSMDRMAASAMVVSREYAELYKEMATKINIYIKDLDSEDYYYGHAYEMFDQSVAAINYIFAKLLKISPLFKTGGVFKEGDEKKQKRLPQNLRDLIETVEEEDVVITFTPEDTPLEVVNKNLGNITDLEINELGEVLTFYTMPKRSIFRIFSSNKETIFTIKDIKKIGEDVILVELD